MNILKSASKHLLKVIALLLCLTTIAQAQADLTPKEHDFLALPVYFYYTHAELNKSAKSHLKDLVEVLKQYPKLKLQIEGHSCNVGNTEKARVQISAERATQVKNFLVKNGIDSKRLTTVGYGTTKPAAKNDSEFGRIKNRRVTFKIIE